MAWEPLVDRGDVHGGFVADGEFVVAGGHGPVALAADAASTAWRSCSVGVEGGRAASARPCSCGGGSGRLLRDGAGDAPSAQVGAVGAGAVGLVGQHPGGRVRGRPGRGGDADGVQHGLELGAVTALARGDQDRQRFLALLAGQVHLGGQPAAGAAQRAIVRLGTHPAGRLGLQVTPFARPGRVLVRPGHRESTHTSQVISPSASARPCSPARICRQVPCAASGGTGHTPSATARPQRHIPPRRTARTRHRIPSISCASHAPAGGPAPAGQQRPQHRPLRVRQVRPPRHR